MKTFLSFSIRFLYVSSSLFSFSWSQISLECDYEKDKFFTGLSPPTKNYCCILKTSFEVGEPNTEVTIENPPADKDEVNCIKIENVKMNYLLHGFDKYFKSIKGLRIDNIELLEFNKEDFAQFPQLKALTITKNKIEIIRKDLFEFCPNLEFINFYDNKLNVIDTRCFANVPKLNKLNLAFNVCIKSNFDTFGNNKKENIEEISTKCSSPEIQFEIEIEELKKSIKESSSIIMKYQQINSAIDNIKKQIEEFENSIQNISISSFKEEMIQKITQLNENSAKVLNDLKDEVKNIKNTAQQENILDRLSEEISELENASESIQNPVNKTKGKSKKISKTENENIFMNYFSRLFTKSLISQDFLKNHEKSELDEVVYQKLNDFNKTMLITMIVSTIGTFFITSVFITCIIKRMKNESNFNENHKMRPKINHYLNNDDEQLNCSEDISIADTLNDDLGEFSGNIQNVSDPIYAKVNKDMKRNRRP